MQPLPEPITYHRTATRGFEVAYWRTILELSAGRFLNKDNADCVHDPASDSLRKHAHRDLEALGDHLLDYYRKLDRQARHDGQGRRRRFALLLADRFRVLLDGAAGASISRRGPRSAICWW